MTLIIYGNAFDMIIITALEEPCGLRPVNCHLQSASMIVVVSSIAARDSRHLVFGCPLDLLTHL